MKIGGSEALYAIDRFTLTLVCIHSVRYRFERAIKGGVVKGMATEVAGVCRQGLHAKCSEFLMHPDGARQNTHEGMSVPPGIYKRLSKCDHSPALCQHGLLRVNV